MYSCIMVSSHSRGVSDVCCLLKKGFIIVLDVILNGVKCWFIIFHSLQMISSRKSCYYSCFDNPNLGELLSNAVNRLDQLSYCATDFLHIIVRSQQYVRSLLGLRREQTCFRFQNYSKKN